MMSSSQRRNRLKHARSRLSMRLRRAAECIQRCWGRFRARCISLRPHPVVTSEKTRRLAYVLKHTGVRDDIYDWYKKPLRRESTRPCLLVYERSTPMVSHSHICDQISLCRTQFQTSPGRLSGLPDGDASAWHKPRAHAELGHFAKNRTILACHRRIRGDRIRHSVPPM